MLQEVFHTKEGRIISALIVLAAIIISILVFTGYTHNKEFVKQAVMAENYLKAGNYAKAVEAYLKALSMNNGDEQLLTIGLADAYSGQEDYDKALEVLRAAYGKTSEIKLKEKIEEITAEKTDFEYYKAVSLAEVYFSNKEYNKAIAEFENAKKIKSKEALSYQRIAEAYIGLGEYNLAREELLEGQEITQDKSLEKVMAIVEAGIKKEQYDTLIAQAAEYILQENYEDGIAQYKEAIELLPEEPAGYSELARIYLSLKEYNKAVLLLLEAVKKTDSNELNDLLGQAVGINESENEKKNLLASLYNALDERNLSAVLTIMDLEVFKKTTEEEKPLLYGGSKGAGEGPHLIIYDSKTVYFGDYLNKGGSGRGIYLIRTAGNPEAGYYYYDGEWDGDIPNGYGKTVKEDVLLDDQGLEYAVRTETEGLFLNALEDGRMKKYFYIKGEAAGYLEYSAKDGVPVPLASKEDGALGETEQSDYIIGMLTLEGKPTDEYYRVEPATIWGVQPFINKQ